MKEVLKSVKKTMGKKLYGEIKTKFPTRNKFEKFCKRHEKSTKEFFEAKLASFAPKKEEKKEEAKEEKKEEAKAE